MNESDYDTTAPEADESYLDESEPDPFVSEEDFDVTPPPEDTSYLDDAEAEAAAADAERTAPRDAPGPALAAVLAGLGAAAVALRRR